MLGNWVLVNGVPRKVEAVTKKKIGYHTGPLEPRMYYARLREVEPIPITEDLLRKIHFEYFKGDRTYYSFSTSLQLKQDGDRWDLSISSPTFLVRVKYLHELQQLYWLMSHKRIEIYLK